MSWDEQLQTASFGGIEFDVSATSDELERRVVEHEYAYRNGADLEDTGRAPRPTRMSAVFHGEGYLTRLTELQRLVDTGETRLLRHPLLGTWQAKALRMSITHEHSKRDAADVELEFREDGTSTQVPLIESIGKAEQQLATGLEDLATAYTDLDEDVPEVDSLTTDATSYADDLAESVDTRLTRFAQLDVRARDAVLALDVLEVDAADLALVPVIAAIRQVQLGARAMREAYDAAQPSVTEHDLSADVALSAVAAALYDDASREEDLLRLNRIKNPFMGPAGTRIKVHGR
jgi:prophage DNA circulation protein